MMKSMKKMLLMATIAVMVLSLAAGPAMAHNEEAHDHQNDPSARGPVGHEEEPLVSDAVGEVIDGIGETAGDAWEVITSWF